MRHIPYTFTGPAYADGPFCRVRIYRDADGGTTTYTDAQRGVAVVHERGTLVNMLGVAATPVWRVEPNR